MKAKLFGLLGLLAIGFSFTGCFGVPIGGWEHFSVSLNLKANLITAGGLPVNTPVKGTLCAYVKTDMDGTQGVVDGMPFCAKNVSSDASTGVILAAVSGQHAGTPRSYKMRFFVDGDSNQKIEGQLVEISPKFNDDFLTGNLTANFIMDVTTASSAGLETSEVPTE